MNGTGELSRACYLKPGELVVSREPLQVSTVLGSCIAVTMFNPRSKTAAICHAMLPSGGNQGGDKFVDVALKHMLERLSGFNVGLGEIEVKLFGGADMFDCVGAPSPMTVGQQNIRAATGLLERYGLALAASDVGGRQGRKLIFHSDTGVVMIKRLTSQDPMSRR